MFVANAALAFVIVFVAEFADKTQLALLAMSARGRCLRVWIGASAAFLLLTVSAAALGGIVERLVAREVVVGMSVALFLLFGALSLRGLQEKERHVRIAAGVVPAFAMTLVAELGDKTQIAVAALAAESGSVWATALGGTLALWASAALAIVAGGWIGRRVPQNIVRRVGGVLFIAFGVGIAVLEFLA